MKIKTESCYEDGHESSEILDIPEPGFPYSDEDDDLEEFLHEYTGDGHGIGNDMGFCYTITILKAADARYVDRELEWVG